AEAAKTAAARLDRELKQARAEEAALASRENRIALAGVLFVIGALAAGAGLLFYSQKAMRNAKIAGGAGAVLMIGAAILFVTRPDAHAEIAGETEQAPAPDVAPKLAQGNFLCTIQPDRSRITVSSTIDVPVEIGGDGCINRRTQYAQGTDGRWQRILVPNEEATVTIASIDDGAHEYRVERYLLDAETMAKARALRAAAEIKGCAADPQALAAFATQQDAIKGALPPTPNERLVYRCQKVAGSAAATP
ncbi:MAG: serine protease, partial [Sphingopyxis granuli]